jgi:serine/threonine protein kinase
MGAGYKVIKKLGEGAFGSVELIEKDHKYYALKSISLDK